MLLKQLDATATTAWSPSTKQPNFLASATIPGGDDAFSSYDGKLSISSFNVSDQDPQMHTIGQVSTNTRFQKLAWCGFGIDSGTYPAGLIAGGMADGHVNIFNPHAIMQGANDQAVVLEKLVHQGPVKALEFNPFKPNLLASGGADSEVYILNLESSGDVYKPGTPNQHIGSEITCLQWNRKVQHVFASSSQSGMSVIWDLKAKKPVMSFSDPGGRQRCSSLAWNPDLPTQLIVAYDDDRNPTLQVWDLRNPNYPFKELAGHHKGILSVSWCPFDSSLLLSCGKDNRTLCWNFSGGHGEIMAELPTRDWNFDVQWSPALPALLSTSSFNGKVSVFSLQDGSIHGSVPSQYAPKWLKRPVGASFGFGNKLVSFHSSQQGAPLLVHNVTTEQQLLSRSDYFETVQDVRSFCQEKTASVHDEHERDMWTVMEILFKPDARHHILSHLGFDATTIAQAADNFIGKKPPVSAQQQQQQQATKEQPGADGSKLNHSFANLAVEDAEGFFDQLGANTSFEHKQAETDDDDFTHLSSQSTGSPQIPNGVTASPAMGSSSYQKPADWNAGPESLIKKSLVVGNFEAAVECCMKCGRMAEALLLASCGGADLWQRTQEEYLRQQKDPFMKVVSGIMKGELSELVRTSELNSWKETLAILSTYAKSDEFPQLCDMLAQRLETEKFDILSAIICYMCALDFNKTVEIWANMSTRHSDQTEALQDLVEKVTVFRQASGFSGKSDIFVEKLDQYAAILASQGKMASAMKYLSMAGDDYKTAIMRDRIYHSAPQHMQGLPVPPFPFQREEVRPHPSVQQSQHQQQQQQQQQQHQAGRTPAGYGAYGAQSAQPTSSYQPSHQPHHPPAASASAHHPPASTPYPGGHAPAAATPTYTPQSAATPTPYGAGYMSTPSHQPTHSTGYGAYPAAPAPAPAPAATSAAGPTTWMPSASPPAPQPAAAAHYGSHTAMGSAPSTAPAMPAYTPLGATPTPGHTAHPGHSQPSHHGMNGSRPAGPVVTTSAPPAINPTQIRHVPQEMPAATPTGYSGAPTAGAPPTSSWGQQPAHTPVAGHSASSSWSQPASSVPSTPQPGSAWPASTSPHAATTAPSQWNPGTQQPPGPMPGAGQPTAGYGGQPYSNVGAAIPAVPSGHPVMNRPAASPPSATTSGTAKLPVSVYPDRGALYLDHSKPKEEALPPVSLNEIPAEFRHIADILNTLLTNSGETGRKLEDVKRRLDELYSKLARRMISEMTLAKLNELCQAVQVHDYARASKLHIELSSAEWDANKNWLVGLKRLLQIMTQGQGR